MTLDTLIRKTTQAQTRTTLDLLIGSDTIEGRLNAFLLAGKVEGLAPPTLLYYKDTLNRFIKCFKELRIIVALPPQADSVCVIFSTRLVVPE